MYILSILFATAMSKLERVIIIKGSCDYWLYIGVILQDQTLPFTELTHASLLYMTTHAHRILRLSYDDLHYKNLDGKQCNFYISFC